MFGGEFVSDDIFAPADTTEFTPYMEEIIDSGADSFLVTWAGGGFVPMMQAAIDLGAFDEMSMGASFVDNVVMPAFFGNNIGNTSGILYHYTAADNEINVSAETVTAPPTVRPGGSFQPGHACRRRDVVHLRRGGADADG